ncbi:MAG: molybdopterin-dependent oxidoreductase [Deltaproteobacteria bacterium]|nr:molybdopterin-dependent oxidoreductase [Deltaproteobacteria bacterium]
MAGQPCRTAFTCLREHVRGYTPEAVARITTLPAETVRRIATEFGQAAEIGSTIEIDGHALPHRPACASWYRGAIAHKHAMLSGLAIQFLNIVAGAIDVPGGHLGVSPVCLTPPVRWTPGASDEGLLVPQGAIRRRKLPYPAWKARAPQTLDLLDLLPVAPYSTTLFVENMLHPERYGVPYRPEVLINCRSNLLMTTANPETMAEVLRRVPFMVAFACEMNETAELADLVLPDTHYLERLDAFPNESWEFVGAGQGSWYWMVRQPVVPPQGEARHWVEVLFEVARRVGFLGDVYLLLNGLFDLKPPYTLDARAVYTWEELADRWMKSLHGPEHGLEYFKAHGCLVTGPKRIEEAYPRPFLTPRLPLYLEHFQRAGDDLRQVTQELGLDWDLSDYQPLPDWKPCPGYEPHDGYDLLAVNYKLPYHSLAYTAHNPWLSGLGELDSRAYRVLLHAAVGRAKGIATGDRIWIESDAGFRVQGEAYLTEGVHPEVVGIAACLGQWAAGKPRAWGRGVHFNTLLPNTLERVDMLSAALDACIRVKVWKS